MAWRSDPCVISRRGQAGGRHDLFQELVTPYPIPEVKLPRGARRVSFVPGRRALVVLQGEMRHNNFWYIDLETGARRQLTSFGRGFTIRDFDITPDGAEVVFDRRQENSDVVLIELQGRGRR